MTRKIGILLLGISLSLGHSACGGGGGGGGVDVSSSTTIEGTLASSSATSRVLGAGEGGLGGVTVSALGDSATTDELGNFNLFVDGEAFSGGTVEFTFSGEGVASTVPLEGVLGGPGATAYVNFTQEDTGDIIGESTDASGNVLGRTPGVFGCDFEGTFVDGGEGTLWKPLSERTGTVVVLMPPEYRNADVEILNSSGDSVATPVLRDCCSHNGGREHIYLSESASSLAGMGAPLTVRFTFPDGFVDCREVPSPTQRYD